MKKYETERNRTNRRHFDDIPRTRMYYFFLSAFFSPFLFFFFFTVPIRILPAIVSRTANRRLGPSTPMNFAGRPQGNRMDRDTRIDVERRVSCV